MNIDTEVGSDLAERQTAGASNDFDMCTIAHEAFFLFRIGNYSQLAKAFGAEIAQEAVASVRANLAGLVENDGSVALCRDDVVGVRLVPGPTLGTGFDSERCNAWLRMVCETVPLIPIACGGITLHVWISGFWTFRKDQEDQTSQRWQFPYACPGQGRPGWAEQYRSDMLNISRVLVALQGRGQDEAGVRSSASIQPFWQRIHSVKDGATQFFEALARVPELDGGSCSIAPCVLSLERTGFVRLLDLHMARLVIAELERSPDIQAAVNLSALSLHDDGWWSEIRSALRDRPTISARLFLEITETAPFPDISEVVRFVDGMRRLGCRIVLDDFGTGHASIRQLFALSPDVVKIDRLFLRRAGISKRDREIFTCLAGLAISSGATVVAEGVETLQQKQIALEAGVDWQQGYLWGPASGGHPRAGNTAKNGLPAMSAAL